MQHEKIRSILVACMIVPGEKQQQLELQEPGTRPPQELSSVELPCPALSHPFGACSTPNTGAHRRYSPPIPGAFDSFHVCTDPTRQQDTKQIAHLLHSWYLKLGTHLSSTSLTVCHRFKAQWPLKMTTLTNFTGQAYQPQEDKYVRPTLSISDLISPPSRD